MDFGVLKAARVKVLVAHNCVWDLHEILGGRGWARTVLVAQIINLCQLHPAINFVVESVQQRR